MRESRKVEREAGGRGGGEERGGGEIIVMGRQQNNGRLRDQRESGQGQLESE